MSSKGYLFHTNTTVFYRIGENLFRVGILDDDQSSDDCKVTVKVIDVVDGSKDVVPIEHRSRFLSFAHYFLKRGKLDSATVFYTERILIYAEYIQTMQNKGYMKREKLYAVPVADPALEDWIKTLKLEYLDYKDNAVLNTLARYRGIPFLHLRYTSQDSVSELETGTKFYFGEFIVYKRGSLLAVGKIMEEMTAPRFVRVLDYILKIRMTIYYRHLVKMEDLKYFKRFAQSALKFDLFKKFIDSIGPKTGVTQLENIGVYQDVFSLHIERELELAIMDSTSNQVFRIPSLEITVFQNILSVQSAPIKGKHERLHDPLGSHTIYLRDAQSVNLLYDSDAKT